jgi:hypothetical protein
MILLRTAVARLAAATLVITLALGSTACGHRQVHETQISRHYHHGRTQISRHYHHGRLGYERHTATRHRH